MSYDWQQDPLMPEPQLLRPPPPRTVLKPNDVTDFPAHKVVPIPEEFSYPEGKYRPPSLPVRGGFYPSNIYLEAGKVYHWCTCGTTWTEPFCDHKCHYNMMRLRPIAFSVEKSEYYKLCACKQSSNAPFCNGTHKLLAKNYVTNHWGRYKFAGGAAFVLLGVGAWWNFYS
jgi:CDGSH-type Zn-finger protein